MIDTMKTADKFCRPGGGPPRKTSGDASLSSFYHERSSEGETLFCDDGRRRVAAGTFYPSSRTFCKKVQPHQVLRKPEGIALQTSVLRDLDKRRCKTMRVLLVSEGRTLEAPFEAFARHGVPLDRGFGAQVVLPISYWTDVAVRRVQTTLFDEGGLL